MHTFLFRVSVFSLSLLSLNAFCAAQEFSQKFKDQPPFFYAAIASAAYKHRSEDAQAYLDKKIGAGKATVLQTVPYKQSLYGNTNMILVKDDKNRLHVGFEGSTDLRNWVRNFKSLFKTVDKDVLRGMHGVITDWEKFQPGSTLVSIVGHSQGGMYASQMAKLYASHYTKPRKTKSGKIDRSKRSGRAAIITFNAYKPKKRGNQYHFATKKECGATLFSSSGRYIPIDYTVNRHNGDICLYHGMKHIIRALRGKTWEDFKKHDARLK